MVGLLVEDLDGWWTHIKKNVLTKSYPITVKQPTLYF